MKFCASQSYLFLLIKLFTGCDLEILLKPLCNELLAALANQPTFLGQIEGQDEDFLGKEAKSMITKDGLEGAPKELAKPI